jgi:hypothetical protein
MEFEELIALPLALLPTTAHGVSFWFQKLAMLWA